jgi:hypothetical protein
MLSTAAAGCAVACYLLLLLGSVAAFVPVHQSRVRYDLGVKAYLFDVRDPAVDDPPSTAQFTELHVDVLGNTGDELGTDYVGSVVSGQHYNATSGFLNISGLGTSAQWALVLERVWFRTNSTDAAVRTVTWGLSVNDTVFAPHARRWRQWVVGQEAANASHHTAASLCSQRTFLGYTGVLPTVLRALDVSSLRNFARKRGASAVWLGPRADFQYPPDGSWGVAAGWNRSLVSPYGPDCAVGVAPVAGYPPWFPPNVSNTSLTDRRSILKLCLKKFGNPRYCPDTPIGVKTVCSVQCRNGVYCAWDSGLPTNAPPQPAVTSVYPDPTWWSQNPIVGSGQIPESWRLSLDPTPQRALAFMDTSGVAKFVDVSGDGSASRRVVCEFGGEGRPLPYATGGAVQVQKHECLGFTSQPTCASSATCQWNASLARCERRTPGCASLPNVTGCRQARSECWWDARPSNPGTCSVQTCALKYSSMHCDSESTCMWATVSGVPQCTAFRCALMSTPCSCYGQHERNCFWDPSFVSLDGGSVGRCLDTRFAACESVDFLMAVQRRHIASDYESLISTLEAFRRTLHHLPLTGSNFGDPPTNSTGWRVSFIVFDATGDVWYFPNASTLESEINVPTVNTFTGNITEIHQMIDAVEDSMSHVPGTVQATGVLTNALRLFQNGTIDSARRGVLFMVTTTDSFADPSAFATSSNAYATAQITPLALRVGAAPASAGGIEFCGILPTADVSRCDAAWFYRSTAAQIEFELSRVCLPSTGAWGNRTVNNATTRAGVCRLYANSSACEADPVCLWYGNYADDIGEACRVSSCASNACVSGCSTQKCTPNATSGVCERFRCETVGTVSLTACLDLNLPLPNIPRCRFDGSSNISDQWACRTDACAEQGTYLACTTAAFARCEWESTDPGVGFCRATYCNMADEPTCVVHAPLCVWDTRFASAPGCRESKCGLMNSQYNASIMKFMCARTPGCRINAESSNPQNVSCTEDWCHPYPTEAECLFDPLCQWNTDPNFRGARCVHASCGVYASESACNSAKSRNASRDCYWDPGLKNGYAQSTVGSVAALGACTARPCITLQIPGGGSWGGHFECMSRDRCFFDSRLRQCHPQQYGNLPQTDILVLIDGSSQMNRTLGRFDNAFHGTLTLLSRWTSDLPLFLSAWSMSAIGTTPMLRLLVCQFCGASVICPPGANFSGAASEIQDMLAYHFEVYSSSSAPATCLASPAVAFAADQIRALKFDFPGARQIVAFITASIFTDTPAAAILREAQVAADVLVAASALVEAVGQSSDAARLLDTAAFTPVTYSTPINDLIPIFLADVCQRYRRVGRSVNVSTYDQMGPCAPLSSTPALCRHNLECDLRLVSLCPFSDQCANLDCNVPEPAPTGEPEFRCENCALFNGSVRCSWQFDFKLPTTKVACGNSICSSLSTQEACLRRPACTWEWTVCRRAWCQYTSHGPCVNDPGCYWHEVWDACAINPFCSPLISRADCEGAAASGCVWTMGPGARCQVDQCAAYVEEDCVALPRCAWDSVSLPPRCRKACTWYRSEGMCHAHVLDGCEWMTESAVGMPRCRDNPCYGCPTSNRDCVKRTDVDQYGASWTTCRLSLCSHATTSALCHDLRLCHWNSTGAGSCIESHCGKWRLRTLCNEECRWDDTVSPPVCTATTCLVDGPTQVACASLPECSWSAARGVCTPAPGAVRCPMRTLAQECAANPRCHWQTTQSQCSYAHAIDCRPDDVAFVLSSDLRLDRPLGRLPNGIAAVYDAFQSWLDEASLTGSTTGIPPVPALGPRLRAGMVRLGNETRPPSTPKAGSLNGLSGAAFQLHASFAYFFAADQRLNSNSSISGLDTVAPGLLRARSMLQANAVAGRNQTIVVVAFGALADHDDAATQVQLARQAGIRVVTVLVEPCIDGDCVDPFDWQRLMSSVPTAGSVPNHFTTVRTHQFQSEMLEQLCNPTSPLLFPTPPTSFVPSTVCQHHATPHSCVQSAQCEWNSSPRLRCLNPRGCSNLDCLELEAESISLGYTCETCQVFNGTVHCVHGVTFTPPAPGQCQAARWQLYPTQTYCNNQGSDYVWSKGACVRKACGSRLTTPAACDAATECAWNNVTGGCGLRTCALATTSELCKQIGDCTWDVSTFPHVCVSIPCQYGSDTVACIADSRCVVLGGECFPIACDHITSAAACHDYPLCTWDPVDDACRRNICANRTFQAQCEENPIGACEWTYDSYRDECEGHLRRETCVLSPRCEWNAALPKCQNPFNCVERPCKLPARLVSQSACDADRRCGWTGATCDRKNYCSDFNGNEVQCLGFPDCHWFQRPSGQRCAAKTGAVCQTYGFAPTCNADSKCSWNNVALSCQVRKCPKFSTCGCSVAADEDGDRWCAWDGIGDCHDGRFVNCANADILFLVDGSAASLRPSGQHTVKYAGVYRYLYDWILNAPLTNTALSAVATNSTPGVRVGFAKLGNSANQCPQSGTIGCNISGSIAEVESALRESFFSYGADEAPSLDDVIEALGASFSSSSDRLKVLVILASSPLLASVPAITHLKSLGAAVIGIDVAVDTHTRSSLLPLADVVIASAVDELMPVALSNLCQPFHPIGRFASKQAAVAEGGIGCRGLPRDLCKTRPTCAWMSVPASSICRNGGCPSLGCAPLPTDLHDAGFTCANCEARGAEVKCSRDVGVLPVTDACVPGCRNYCTSAHCATALGCTWDSTGSKCNAIDPVVFCEDMDEAECTISPHCLWHLVSGTCVTNPCLRYTEGSCNSVGLCRWDSYAWGTDDDPFCVPNDCPFNSTDCVAAGALKPGCMWSNATCVFDPCSVHSAGSRCRLLDGCDWHISCGTATETISRLPPLANRSATWTVDAIIRHSFSASLTLDHLDELSERVYAVPATSQALESAAAITTVALGVAQPSVATLAGRQNAIRSVIACSSGFDPALQPPDRDTNPFMWKVSVGAGSDAEMVHAADLHAGTVFFGVALFVGFSTFAAGAGAAYAQILRSKCPTTDPTSAYFRRGFAMVRFPGVTGFVYAYASGFVMQSAVMVVLSPATSAATSATVGCVALVATVVPAVVGCWGFRRWFRHIFVASPDAADNFGVAPRKNWARAWNFCFEDVNTWGASSSFAEATGDDFMRQYAFLFDGLTDRAPWFLAVDTLLLGLAGGVASRLTIVIGCPAGAWLLFGVYVAYLVLLARFRPFSVRLELVGVAAVSASQSLSVLLAAVQSSYGESFERIAAAAEIVSTAATMLLTFLTVVSAVSSAKAFLAQRMRKDESDPQPIRPYFGESADIEAPLLLVPVQAEDPTDAPPVGFEDLVQASAEPAFAAQLDLDLFLATVTANPPVAEKPQLPATVVGPPPETDYVEERGISREYINSFWHGDNPLAMYTGTTAPIAQDTSDGKPANKPAPAASPPAAVKRVNAEPSPAVSAVDFDL